MREYVIPLLTAALATLGFSILFYVHPRRLLLASFGGLLTMVVYLLAGLWLDGDVLPNFLAAVVGAGYAEISARITRVPVPVYMLPAVVPLVPGSGMYATMFNLVSGRYDAALSTGLTTLQVALGIAGGIVIASVVSLLLRPRPHPAGEKPGSKER